MALRPDGSLSPRAIPTPRATVLLVDDDPDLQEIVVAMLDAVGLEVDAVETAEEGLERLRSRRPDLLVLDWSLPGMSGLELCKRLRRDPAFGKLAILFLTAHAGTQDMVEAFAAGADDYVVKPFRAAELGARIFGLLRRSRLSGSREPAP
jgi:two-component system phosphate regulon response regulator PhoB